MIRKRAGEGDVLFRIWYLCWNLTNIAPSQKVLTIRFNPEIQQRSLKPLQWGLIPHWAKDSKIAYRTINARAETVDKAPSFRKAFIKRRCLIPADGFYEGRKTAKPKLPFAIVMKDGRSFTFAGLWENWKDPESGEWLRTCTIITGEPNELVAQIHPRMPVILPEQHYAAWLGETFHLVTKPVDFPGAELVCGE